MSDTSIERLRKYLVDNFSLKGEDIKPAATLSGDLGLDEQDLDELWMGLKATFGSSFPSDQTQKLKTVDDVVKYMDL